LLSGLRRSELFALRRRDFDGPGQGLTRGLEAEQRDGARLSFGQYEVKAGNSNQKYWFSTVPIA